MENKVEHLRIEYDSNWKRLIERHPREFIRFFMPKIYPLIDFKYRPRLAKQELSKIAGKQKKKGGMVADIIPRGDTF